MKVFDYVNLTQYKQVINLPTRVIRPMPRVPVELLPGEDTCREIVVKVRAKAKMGRLVEREVEPTTERPSGETQEEVPELITDSNVESQEPDGEPDDNQDEAEDTAEKEE